MENPFLKKGEMVMEQEVKSKEKSKQNEFTIMKKPEIESKFDKKSQEEKKKFDEERRYQAIHINDDEPDELGTKKLIIITIKYKNSRS